MGRGNNQQHPLASRKRVESSDFLHSCGAAGAATSLGMADPSQQTVAQWNGEPTATLRVVGTWAGFNDELLTSVAEYFDAGPEEPCRAFAVLTADDEEAYLAEGEVNGRPLGRLAKAKVVLFFRGCRVAAGLQPTAAAVLEVERARALGATTPEVAASTSADTSTVTNATTDVPFNGVVWQTGSATCKRISDEAESGYYDEYAATHGDPPVRIQQPTIEQLSCFWVLIYLRSQIYVDFAVFVPLGVWPVNSQG